MSDSHLYTRLLLSKGHGYPLFHPQPFDDLPTTSREVGTQVGDVGIITPDGAFDVIFNICRPADDPANRFGVPTGFEQIELVPEDMASRPRYHRPGSDISNTKISKRRVDVDAGVDGNVFLPVTAGAVIEITASSQEAAVLFLPDGASRTDVRPLQQLRDYALEHARRWYEFVNGPLQRMVDSNDLYLVTGVDKCTSWSVAAIENHSQDGQISLRLKAAPVGGGRASYAWEWETSSSFADSGPRRGPGEDEFASNQTVFLRGFKVAIRPPSKPFQKKTTAASIVESDPSELLSRSGFIPFSRSPTASSSIFSRRSAPAGGESLSGGNDRASDGSVEYFPPRPRTYHPASAINARLLDLFPEHDVAVTHDDEWGSILNEVSSAFNDLPAILMRLKEDQKRALVTIPHSTSGQF
ncbi:hypothetical protein FB45DRAFT_1033828 [Roridomyces roridus]|uniref:Uncharacterized protein n=1 Tax=Roridomyces roridus TaxID=1738132 RepID=A0AAD7FGB4_9AGAR|nr:hypothetical protein FB45DRAFT_1033828 [Roridomyces roridus]